MSKFTSGEIRVIAALTSCFGPPLYATEIMDLTGLSSGRLYPALLRLERHGVITSAWDEVSQPRRRIYAMANKAAMAKAVDQMMENWSRRVGDE